MIINLPLASPTDVARSGSNKAWANVGDILNSPSSYATIGTFLPGDIGDYVRLSIPAPSPALGILPTTLTLSLNAALTAADLNGTEIVCDWVSLGNSGSTVSPNVGTGVPFTSTDTVYTFSISTSGITLSELNAGTAQIFIAVSALPTQAFNAANWSVVVSPAGTQNYTPGTSTMNQSTTFTVTATWTGSGGAPTYVNLLLSGTAIAGSDLSGPFTGTASANNGLGFAASGAINYGGSGPVTQVAAGSKTEQITTVSGVATTTVLMNVTSNTMSGSVNAKGSMVLTATAVAPDPMTLRMDSVGLTYVLNLPPGEPVRYLPGIGVRAL